MLFYEVAQSYHIVLYIIQPPPNRDSQRRQLRFFGHLGQLHKSQFKIFESRNCAKMYLRFYLCILYLSTIPYPTELIVHYCCYALLSLIFVFQICLQWFRPISSLLWCIYYFVVYLFRYWSQLQLPGDFIERHFAFCWDRGSSSSRITIQKQKFRMSLSKSVLNNFRFRVREVLALRSFRTK